MIRLGERGHGETGSDWEEERELNSHVNSECTVRTRKCAVYLCRSKVSRFLFRFLEVEADPSDNAISSGSVGFTRVKWSFVDENLAIIGSSYLNNRRRRSIYRIMDESD